MTCQKCLHQNEPGSKFCQECGSVLGKKTANQVSGSKIHEVIEPVIFVPKKHNLALRAIVIIICIIFFGVGSLAVIGYYAGKDDTVSISEKTLLKGLFLINPKLQWIQEDLYIIGSVRNTSQKPIKNIVIKVDFYEDEEMTKFLDTRLVSVAEVGSNQTVGFQLPLNIYPDFQYWWVYNIESADWDNL